MKKILKKTKKENSFNYLEVIIIVIVTAIIFSSASILVVYNRLEIKYSSSKEVRKFIEAYNSLDEEYYKDVDKDSLINAAIEAMYNYLDDPYTTYMDKGQTESLLNSLNGEYEGVGIQIKEQDNDTIISYIFEGSPASISGLQVNDIIKKVDNEDVTTYELNDITSIIKNSKNKDHSITVLRNNEELTFNVTRTTIDLPSVSYKKINESNKNYGYLDIDVFGVNTTKEVKNALNEIGSDIDGLIIDVRNNSGGYLQTCSNVAQLFLKKDKIVYILETKGISKKFKDLSTEHTEYPIVVLINNYSASASEILASSLKESYGAILVGEKSYGKGKVQQTTSLDTGEMVKYTTSLWNTPTGENIDGKGITPDIIISNEAISETDSQLDKAIDILNNK